MTQPTISAERIEEMLAALAGPVGAAVIRGDDLADVREVLTLAVSALRAQPQGSETWGRQDLAEALALRDNVLLQRIGSTVGPEEDANNWRKYLAEADDVLSHLSLCGATNTTPPSPVEKGVMPLSTYPESRSKLLAICADVEKSCDDEAAIELADLVKGILEDEVFAAGQEVEDDELKDLTRAQLVDRLKVLGLNAALYADEVDYWKAKAAALTAGRAAVAQDETP